MEGFLLCLALLPSLFLKVSLALEGGMLYPRQSESRQIQEMNGMWNFMVDSSPSRNEGFAKKWYSDHLSKIGQVIPMPVPSSYNDITTNSKIRDFVGWAWYDRTFFVSSGWNQNRIVLRLDSAHYYAVVWLNGIEVTRHDGGHLPFEVVVNKQLNFIGENRITVAVNNTLNETTLPPGTIEYKEDTNRYPEGYFVQNIPFDFFNYAGIHRHVRLYTTPQTYIDDITLKTDVSGTDCILHYDVQAVGGSVKKTLVEVIDRNGSVVATGQQLNSTIKWKNAQLWWPYTMNRDNFGYMYTFKVTIWSSSNQADVYRLPFGVRTVSATSTQLLINSKPFYCHGVDKHEDSDIRGKGLDFPLIARDFNMLKWLGANCFRTSHYPYAEEIMDQADQQGIVVIDECPGVGIGKQNMGTKSLTHHREVMAELIRRDKNRPAVIMWSVANEPDSAASEAEAYFKSVIGYTRQLDPTRLVTFVANKDFNNDKAAQFTDIQCINRYYGWYSDTGHLDVISYQLSYDLQQWYDKLKKPLLISEYGADTVPGLHTMPTFIFTEDYQYDFMAEYHNVFDTFRSKFLVGELVWNFADFMTIQQVNRVVGNKKGVLTRQRQPKAAAHGLRQRYWKLINETLPYSIPPV